MQITQFLYTTLLVSDLDRAKRFYSKVLGLPEVEHPFKQPRAWYQLGEFQIHLIPTSTFGEPVVNFEQPGQNRHITFAVTDLDAIKQGLLSQGYPVQMSSAGWAALFTQDPDSNVIELSQG